MGQVGSNLLKRRKSGVNFNYKMHSFKRMGAYITHFGSLMGIGRKICSMLCSSFHEDVIITLLKCMSNFMKV
jgi:hypothetical protein